MKERAAYVGGIVSVHSSLKRGMEISVQLPYRERVVMEDTK
jgi:signal transduction histidine kinase